MTQLSRAQPKCLTICMCLLSHINELDSVPSMIPLSIKHTRFSYLTIWLALFLVSHTLLSGYFSLTSCTSIKVLYNSRHLSGSIQITARVVELVDTRDLKSLAFWAWRFKSVSGHQFEEKLHMMWSFFFAVNLLQKQMLRTQSPSIGLQLEKSFNVCWSFLSEI